MASNKKFVKGDYAKFKRNNPIEYFWVNSTNIHQYNINAFTNNFNIYEFYYPENKSNQVVVDGNIKSFDDLIIRILGPSWDSYYEVAIEGMVSNINDDIDIIIEDLIERGWVKSIPDARVFNGKGNINIMVRSHVLEKIDPVSNSKNSSSILKAKTDITNTVSLKETLNLSEKLGRFVSKDKIFSEAKELGELILKSKSQYEEYLQILKFMEHNGLEELDEDVYKMYIILSEIDNKEKANPSNPPLSNYEKSKIIIQTIREVG